MAYAVLGASSNPSNVKELLELTLRELPASKLRVWQKQKEDTINTGNCNFRIDKFNWLIVF